MTGFAIWYKPSERATLGFQSFLQVPVGTERVSDTNWKNLSSFLWDVRLTDKLGWTADAGMVFQSEKSDGSRPVVAHSGVWPHLPQLSGTSTHLWAGWRWGIGFLGGARRRSSNRWRRTGISSC